MSSKFKTNKETDPRSENKKKILQNKHKKQADILILFF